MKKLIAIVLAVVLVLTLGSGVALAGKNGKGNGCPSGPHYNLNIIGVPHGMNGNFTGGNGSRIFVDREEATTFYVHGEGTSYAVLDHDGTDGKVGEDRENPGIIFPYDGGKTPTWRVEIYVRLVGPKTSECKWSSAYWDDEWVEYKSFKLTKSSKFQVKTNELLADGYEDMLWTLDEKTKFRNCQMRIYLLD